jgi:hypothetical protein
MQRLLGADLGGVIVHDGPDAAGAAGALGARAFTIGRNVVFGAGEYRPDTAKGRSILAHELVHTVQSGASQVRLPFVLGSADSATEAEAADIARLLAGPEAGWPARPVRERLARPDRVISRQPATGSASAAPQTATPAAAARVQRIEIYLAEHRLVVFRQDAKPLVFLITQVSQLDPGQSYKWANVGGTHQLSTGTGSTILISFRGLQTDLAAFLEGLPAGTEVTAEVHASAGAEQPKQGAVAEPGGAAEGEHAEPLGMDETALQDNRALAQLFVDFEARYAGVTVTLAPNETGLTPDRLRAVTAGGSNALTVARYFTQGWREYQRAGGTSVDGFAAMEEALLTQWSRGNFTALHNRLAFESDQDGMGLFLRGTPLRYYDATGQPVRGADGTFRDPGFRAAAPPSFAVTIRTDPALAQVLSAIRHTLADDPLQVYAAAKGYVDNFDLIWPALLDGWDGWAEVQKALKDQAPVVVGFLAGHTVALALKVQGGPQAVVGVVIDAILAALGRLLQIIFFGTLLELALRCGLELSLIERHPGQPLDRLSERHRQNAMILMRELLVQMAAAGLTAVAVKAARATAISLGETFGGGTGGGPQPAPAVVGGGPSEGGRTGAPAAAAAGGPLPGPPAGAPGGAAMMMEGGGRSRDEGGGRSGAAGGSSGEPPEPALSDKNAGLEQRVDFLNRNRSRLGDVQRSKLDALRQQLPTMKADERAEAAKQLEPWEETVDRSLRQQFASELSQFLPFPVDQASRIPRTGGGEWEQLMRNLRTGRTVRLSITSHTADGAPVQVDEWDSSRRVPLEHKSSADVTAAPTPEARELKLHDLQDQMERHAEFARNWGLAFYEWVVDPDAVGDLVDTAYGKLTNADRGKIRIIPGVPTSSGR